MIAGAITLAGGFSAATGNIGALIWGAPNAGALIARAPEVGGAVVDPPIVDVLTTLGFAMGAPPIAAVAGAGVPNTTGVDCDGELSEGALIAEATAPTAGEELTCGD